MSGFGWWLAGVVVLAAGFLAVAVLYVVLALREPVWWVAVVALLAVAGWLGEVTRGLVQEKRWAREFEGES